MFPKASKDDVKKKFYSLRTNYRKELKKYLQSMKSGSSTDDILYQPTLWYFNERFFFYKIRNQHWIHSLVWILCLLYVVREERVKVIVWTVIIHR